jgi:hypothetical protein
MEPVASLQDAKHLFMHTPRPQAAFQAPIGLGYF